LVDDVLDAATIQSGEFELALHPFDVRASVESCIGLVADAAGAKGLDLSFQCEPDVPRVIVGDSRRLEQIVLSLLHSIYIIARPGCAVLARVPGTTVWWSLGKGEAGEHEPGVLVFAPGAPINFTNAAYVRGRLNDAIAAMADPCRLVVIEASGVIYIDFTGSGILQQLIRDLRGRGIDVAVARLESDRAQRAAARSGLIARLGDDHVFRSVEDAIRSRQSAVPRSTA